MKYQDKETEDIAGILAILGLIFGAPLLIGGIVLWGAFWTALAGWQLYQWFMIPLGAPDINGYHIAGILMLIHFGIENPKTEDSTEKDRTLRIMKLMAKQPIVALLMVIGGFVIAKLAGLI